MTTKHRINALAVALAAFAMACADPASPNSTVIQTAGPLATVTDQIAGYPTGMTAGEVRLCKSVPTGDPAGVTFTFQVTVTSVLPAPGAISNNQVQIIGVPGSSVCTDVHLSTKNGSGLDKVVIVESAPPTNWAMTAINTVRIDDGPGYTPPVPGDVVVEDVGTRTSEVHINNDMGRIVTFTNDHTVPPLAICDFITFGRLVWEEGGNKVVISGNAGGNKPGGGILGEFHVEVNGVDNHVADITSYGPIAAGALSSLTNSRVVTGTAKNGALVELRLWDGGEPGKDTDRVWVKIGATVVIGGANGQFIDQGNMQYHPQCRGPETN